MRRGQSNGTQAFQSGHAEPARHDPCRSQRSVKGKPVKGLTIGQSATGGRNNHGRITSRFRGGGHKQSYRVVDFKRRKFDVPATVERLEYDPNRTAFIALVKYADGELSYILAPQRLRVGDVVLSAARADIKPGNAMPLGASRSARSSTMSR